MSASNESARSTADALLPALTLDFPQPHSAPGMLGKTTVDLPVLPELGFDFREALSVPFLHVRIDVKAGVDAASFMPDVTRLVDALEQREQALGGTGLICKEANRRVTLTWIHLVVIPRSLPGARDRLLQLAREINAAGINHAGLPGLTDACGVFARWEATVHPTFA